MGVIKITPDDENLVPVLCPHCNATFTFSSDEHDRREGVRILVEKTEGDLPDIETPTISEKSHCCVFYAEATVLKFVKSKKDQAFLLDINQNGLGFIIQANDATAGLNRGDQIHIDIDFPVLDSPETVKVEIRWIQPVMGGKFYRVGVKFITDTEAFQETVQKIVQFVEKRNQKASS